MLNRKKVKIVAVGENVKFGLKSEFKPVYIGWTERTPETYLQGLKAMLKDKCPSLSVKMQNLPNVNFAKLRVKVLSNCFEDELPEKISHLIRKYDTQENGWNTISRTLVSHGL